MDFWLCKSYAKSIAKIASLLLFHLNRNKQILKVAKSKSIVVVSLYNLEKQSWSVLHWFGKNL